MMDVIGLQGFYFWDWDKFFFFMNNMKAPAGHYCIRKQKTQLDY